jgi:hypothetical protein
MKITKQSIKWLGDNRVRITTVRSKSGGGSWVSIWGVGVSSHSRGRSARTSDVLHMDYQRYLIERREIQRGRFKDYDPSEYYEYNSEKAYTPEEQFKEVMADISQKLYAWANEKHRQRQQRKQQVESHQQAMNISQKLSAWVDEKHRQVTNDAPLPRTNWWRAIVVTTVFWGIFIPLAGIAVEGSVLFKILSFGMVVAWVVLPIAIYKDALETVDDALNWSPRVWVYVLSSLIPIINFVAGVTYLVRRRYGHEQRTDENNKSGNQLVDNI